MTKVITKIVIAMALLAAVACQPQSRLYSARAATLPNGSHVEYAGEYVFVSMPERMEIVKVNTRTGAVVCIDSCLNYRIYNRHEN